MTYEQVVAKVKAKFTDVDASAIDGVVALQINLEGKNVNGIFYIEVKDHNVNVEPYEYYDRHAIVTVNPTNLMKLLEGKLDPIEAYNKGLLDLDDKGNPKFVLSNALSGDMLIYEPTCNVIEEPINSRLSAYLDQIASGEARHSSVLRKSAVCACQPRCFSFTMPLYHNPVHNKSACRPATPATNSPYKRSTRMRFLQG